ncbi:MAG: AbrB/MazE/SpoVT family DNA-binding domain-containing protein [Methylococcaceae bacterium]|nr:AbrB/MazE/SpoVT family DNA-binding domain-containing protein [Methylococcaceae bacterium]
MTTVTMSSKGQVVLPAAIRRRLGLMAGSQLDIIEEQGEVRLVPTHPITPATVVSCAGMVTAPLSGKPRRLADFDAVTLTACENK